jgi:putative endonuclease
VKSSYVYIITNRKNGTLYIGVTNDLVRRLYEHKHKLVEGYSKKYGLDKLVFFEQFINITDAIAAEKKIKGWTRSKKVSLIETKNPDWSNLDSSFDSE